SLERRRAVRVNRLRVGDTGALLADLAAAGFLLDPIGWCPDAYFLRGDLAPLAASPFFASGQVFIQNSSSFVPVLALDPQPGDTILDIAAAPGGKASHVAAIVGNQCELWVNDPLAPRRQKLAEVVATLGVRVAGTTSHPGQYIDRHLEPRFDRILLDAQCSGEGQLDLRHPGALRYWSLARVHKYARLQQRMLMAAFKLLRPGGTLVYSTCTFAPEEDEHPVDHLVRHAAGARVVPIDVDAPGRRPGLRSWEGRAFGAQLAHAVRITPSEAMEGFFVARITKS
ncbi:MAG: hypothetical protein ACRD0D_08055, partial [Acidimicrobiales bacterium]